MRFYVLLLCIAFVGCDVFGSSDNDSSGPWTYNASCIDSEECEMRVSFLDEEGEQQIRNRTSPWDREREVSPPDTLYVYAYSEEARVQVSIRQGNRVVLSDESGFGGGSAEAYHIVE